MIIKKIAVGNTQEAYIEDSFSQGMNVITSDDNNKGKTVIIQSILYAMGNKPIFPESFSYKDYYYYLEFEHSNKNYILLRASDSYVLKSEDGLRIFEGMAEFKRFWSVSVFKLPQIVMSGDKQIVDMELFVQLFFVGQDGKNTATIFNAGYYHKDDFRNMLLSYSGDFSDALDANAINRIRKRIKELRSKYDEQIKLNEFYKSSSVATEYLSRIKDQEAFHQRVDDIESATMKISDLRKKRTHMASRRALWNNTLKELRSLNRTIEVGELRCMDCNSSNISFKGMGKTSYSFNVSTPEMRNQIISSIEAKISAIKEDIVRLDYEIASAQAELQDLMDDENVTVENVMAYKQGFHSAEEIEEKLLSLAGQIKQLTDELEAGVKISDSAKEQQEDFFARFMALMNEIKRKIDIESETDYEDIFTKQGSTISGSEETVFYVARLLSIAEMIHHDCPIIMDSFRAEDLSTEKEDRVIALMSKLNNQFILTTTLKDEEAGKYSAYENIHVIDYSAHTSFKLLTPDCVPEFKTMLSALHMEI